MIHIAMEPLDADGRARRITQVLSLGRYKGQLFWAVRRPEAGAAHLWDFAIGYDKARKQVAKWWGDVAESPRT